MAETCVTLSSTWQLVASAAGHADKVILGDPAQAGDICWSTDDSLNSTTTVGGVPLGIAWDFVGIVPHNKLFFALATGVFGGSGIAAVVSFYLGAAKKERPGGEQQP